MPFSDDRLNWVAERLIRAVRPGRCLDIGAGAGKYGKLAREHSPTTVICGLEVESTYIEEYSLRDIYHEIRCAPASSLFDTDLDSAYDLVIIGDCIEHLKKSEGIDLLNFLVYRTKYMLVVYPERYPQGAWEGHKHEAHISAWADADFGWLSPVLIRDGPFVAMMSHGYLWSSADPNVESLFGDCQGMRTFR